MIHEIFSSVIDWYMGNINYFSVTLLMAIESSFIPFPSEIIVPPAAWKAAQGELNIWLVFVSSTIGALIGALVNYYLAFGLGRAVIYQLADTKWAHMLLINREGIQKAEEYFNKHGKSSTFVGRLIPAIRQLISLPAGVARMDMKSFLLFTTAGAGIWNAILAALGYFLFTQKELLNKYYHRISYLLLFLGGAFVLYLISKALKSRKVSS